MLTWHFDDREIQLLLVALRYWRAHRSEGVTRRTDPHLTPDLVDTLVAKLATGLPPPDREVRLTSIDPEPTTANDTPPGPDPKTKPNTRR